VDEREKYLRIRLAERAARLARVAMAPDIPLRFAAMEYMLVVDVMTLLCPLEIGREMEARAARRLAPQFGFCDRPASPPATRWTRRFVT